jgi:alkanesulfonate monooxygenase SsuD/methylene tetrahydromethanopterin reductase-like flavin-dependent oxidoreductase (luciferase family)
VDYFGLRPAQARELSWAWARADAVSGARVGVGMGTASGAGARVAFGQTPPSVRPGASVAHGNVLRLTR